jgi:MFS family permease
MRRLSVRGYFSGLTRSTYFLALASLFSDISTEMLYPVMPIFLTQTLKASGSIVGMVDGFAQAAQNIIQGFSGALSDKLRKRKPIALIGFLLAAIAKPLMGVASAWQGFLGARLLDRLSAGARSPARDALIAASVDEKDRGRAFGLEGVGDNAGAFIGPLLAVLLLYAMHVDIRTIFYLAIIPGLLAFCMVLFVSEKSTAVPLKSKIALHVQRFPPGYWKYLSVTALFNAGNSSNAFLILRTQDTGVSLRSTILIYAGFNLAAALISYPAGALSDRIGRKTILLLSFLIFFMAYLGFGLTTNHLAIVALFIFYGLFQGIFRAVGKTMASDFVPQALRASGIGWYSTTVGLAQLLASVIAGILWDRVGHTAVFFYGATFAAAGSVALVALIPRAPAA